MARCSTSRRGRATDTYSYAAGTGSGTAPAGGSGLDGTTIVLAANTFTEPGYTFAGWSDGNATYAAGATYTLASNGSAIVLTATWTANATDTVTFNSEGGSHGELAERPPRHHDHLAECPQPCRLRLQRLVRRPERGQRARPRPTP